MVNLDEISRWERARSRYFLRYNHGPWEQVSEIEFIVAERERALSQKLDVAPWQRRVLGVVVQMAQ